MKDRAMAAVAWLLGVQEWEDSHTRYKQTADLLVEMQSRIEALEKDAARYALSKKHYDIRISRYKGKYRADNGSRVLTGWMDSYDECFDAAMKSEKGGV